MEFQLRSLSFPLRLAVTALALVLAGGYLASLAHLEEHYRNKVQDGAAEDGHDALSVRDLVGAYHGSRDAILLDAVEGEHGAEFVPDEEETRLLLHWLRSARVAEDYDNIDLARELGLGIADSMDDPSPAGILDLRCASCHSRADGRAEGGVSFDGWTHFQDVAFVREIHPVPTEILTVSTHTHALTLPIVALAAALMFLGTRLLPRFLRDAVVMVCCVGMLVDLACMWLIRGVDIGPIWIPGGEGWVWGIVAGGAAFGGALAIQLAVVLIDTWSARARD